jgi:hypothetical protein
MGPNRSRRGGAKETPTACLPNRGRQLPPFLGCRQRDANPHHGRLQGRDAQTDHFAKRPHFGRVAAGLDGVAVAGLAAAGPAGKGSRHPAAPGPVHSFSIFGGWGVGHQPNAQQRHASDLHVRLQQQFSHGDGPNRVVPKHPEMDVGTRQADFKGWSPMLRMFSRALMGCGGLGQNADVGGANRC